MAGEAEVTMADVVGQELDAVVVADETPGGAPGGGSQDGKTPEVDTAVAAADSQEKPAASGPGPQTPTIGRQGPKETEAEPATPGAPAAGAATPRYELKEGKVSFKAAGADQNLTLDETVEMAQGALGWKQEAERLRKNNPELARLRAQEQAVAAAFEDDTGATLLSLMNRYRKALRLPELKEFAPKPAEGAEADKGKRPEAEPAAEGPVAPELEAGAAFIKNVIHPYLGLVAEAYGADQNELAALVVDMFAEEPDLDFDAIDLIMNARLQEDLAANGYGLQEGKQRPAAWNTRSHTEGTANGDQRRGRGRLTPAGRRAATQAETTLQQENAALKAELAGLKAGTGAARTPGPGAKAGAPSGAAPQGTRDPREKSEILDLAGADTLEAIMERVGAIPEN